MNETIIYLKLQRLKILSGHNQKKVKTPRQNLHMLKAVKKNTKNL